MTHCLYEILGVDRDADDDALKRAYRKQALIWHPGERMQTSWAVQQPAHRSTALLLCSFLSAACSAYCDQICMVVLLLLYGVHARLGGCVQVVDCCAAAARHNRRCQHLSALMAICLATWLQDWLMLMVAPLCPFNMAPFFHLHLPPSQTRMHTGQRKPMPGFRKSKMHTRCCQTSTREHGERILPLFEQPANCLVHVA